MLAITDAGPQLNNTTLADLPANAQIDPHMQNGQFKFIQNYDKLRLIRVNLLIPVNLSAKGPFKRDIMRSTSHRIQKTDHTSGLYVLNMCLFTRKVSTFPADMCLCTRKYSSMSSIHDVG